MRPEGRVSRWLGSRAGAGVTAVVTMAAAGAVWAMVAIVARQPVPWMAVPMAAAAVLTTGSLDLRARWSRGLCAGLLAAGGTAYALGLATIERLARMLGRGFLETALTAGPEMIAALAWARLDGIGFALILAGPPIAAALAALRRVGPARAGG
jgi:hypothetical protein